MALSADVETEYIKIIDSILASGDLNTISEKRIRKGLQQAVNYDITPQKHVIKPLIMARFDKFMAETNAPPKPLVNGHTEAVKQEGADIPAPASTNGTKPGSADVEESSEAVDTPPPKKKRKRSSVNEDAMFAARLQAEENSRARPTRGGASKKTSAPAKKKKTPKKKTARTVDTADDSDIDSEAAEKKVNRSGGFHKPLNLSASLSALLDGEVQMSRPQTVSKIWQYVREHDLQDPNDKRWIRCDDALRAVFKSDKVHMFTMNKLLAQNLYNPDE